MVQRYKNYFIIRNFVKNFILYTLYFILFFVPLHPIMACILHIETSTDVCSVAVSRDGDCLFDRVEQGDGRGSQASEKIGSMIDEALACVESYGIKPDAVAVSSGPGSYTGLRIGVSMAKGIAYASDAKLIAVPTLKILVNGLPTLNLKPSTLFCPMIDARRMEVFAAVYDENLTEVRPVGADIVDADTYRQYLDNGEVWFFGNGGAKCMPVISHPNARYIPDVQPLARNMISLAEQLYAHGSFEDVAYFTPAYLKEYQAKLPKNLLKA